MLGPWHKYVHFIEWALRQITDVTGNFGLAIIIFTIVLKTLLLPLTVKSIRSTAATQELQPKIKELQKKYGKDRAKLQAETMKLYQEYDINPLAGCLPMVLQIPVFFGLYYGIRGLSHDNAGGFLWLHNLSNPDPYHVLPILAGVFQFAQTKMMRPHGSPKITDPQQQMMQTMMSFMPIMVVLFGWRFAAGPVLYWTTQSVYSVVQQWFITGWGALKDWMPFLPDLPEHRRLGHRKTPLKPVEPGAAPKGLFARMQAQVIEQQQETNPKARRSTAKSTATDGTDEVGLASATGKRARRARGAGSSVVEGTVSGGAGDDAPTRPPKTVPRRTRATGANGATGANDVAPAADIDETGRRRK